MANRCNNKVTFTGSEDNLNRVLDLFNQMMDNENKGSIGQIPDFVESKNGHFADIAQNKSNKYAFCYDTFWSPNFGILIQTANHCNVDFLLDYEEYGMKLFGRTIYKNHIFKDCRLNMADFIGITYDTETDKFEFEGKTYGDDIEIMRILLERKIALELS